MIFRELLLLLIIFLVIYLLSPVVMCSNEMLKTSLIDLKFLSLIIICVCFELISFGLKLAWFLFFSSFCYKEVDSVIRPR